MGRFTASRLLQTLPVLLGVSFIVFISVYLLPGDVTSTLLGLAASKERMAVLAHEMGLDRPLHEQYVIWLGNVLSGDLGLSHLQLSLAGIVLALLAVGVSRIGAQRSP